MNLSFYRLCQYLGYPPSLWMIPNPIKVYEYTQVTTLSQVSAGENILDLGCGNAHWTMLLARKCAHAVGVEPNKDKIETAIRFVRNSQIRKKMDFIASTLEEAQFPDASFDHVFSFCVLEHIPTLHDVLVEVHRILKPGGKLHVSVDSLGTIEDSTILAKHKADHGVFQYFTVTSLDEQLTAAGFRVKSIDPILKSDFAKTEFTRRIQGGYKHNPVQRFFVRQKIMAEDQKTSSSKGIMIVGRAERP